MKPLTLDALCDRLLAAKDALILTHVNPDGDTVGSAVALYRILTKLGKRASVLPEKEFPRRYAFLLDGIPTEEFAGEHTVIAVDIASPAQLGSFAARFTPDLQIDHHEFGNPFADHSILPKAAACGEVIFALAKHLITRGALDGIDRETATALYAAISSDTGCFCYSNVKQSTHLAAAELLTYGINAAEINHRLFHTKTKEQLAAEAYVLSHLSTAKDGKIALFALSYAEKEALGLPEDAFEAAIDLVRTLEGAEVAVTLKEKEAGVFKVSLRSTGISVAETAAAFGGGGHARAAGCTLRGKDIDWARTALLSALELAFPD